MRLKRIFELCKTRLFTIGFSIIFNVSLAGLVCGTFAWYTYTTRAGFQDKIFEGTTVANSGELRIGILSWKWLNDAECQLFGLQRQDEYYIQGGGRKNIYWANNNDLSPAILNYFLRLDGYATNELEPTTSSSSETIEQNGFRLYRKPTWKDNYQINNSRDYSGKENYLTLSFAFKTGKNDDEQQSPNAYLLSTGISTSNDKEGSGELHKAVRFYLQNSVGKYIVAPGYTNDGEHDVGGILDLDLNGYYDRDDTNHEIVYGEYSGEYQYENSPRASNDNIPKEEQTSFNSNHQKGVYAVDESTLHPKTVSYYGISRFTSRELAFATPDSMYGGIAIGTMTIYLEGWDQHVIDKEQESYFNLNLSFGS